jgi:hypothetical protein
MIAVGSCTGPELGTRRLHIRVLPRVLSGQSLRRGSQAPPGLIRERIGGRLAFYVLRQVQQGEESGWAENDDVLVCLELEEMVIPTDDVGSSPGDGAF